MAIETKIQIKVSLDTEHVPEKITWETNDPKNGGEQEVKAILVSLFDKESKDTLKLDLWTKELQVIEMDRFMYHCLNSLADTYFKATNNQELSNDMKNFALYFGQKTEIIPAEES
jgi:gliding motility-associated protein GldC